MNEGTNATIGGNRLSGQNFSFFILELFVFSLV